MLNFIKKFLNKPKTIVEFLQDHDVTGLKKYILHYPEEFQKEFTENVDTILEKTGKTFFQEVRSKYPKEFQFINALEKLVNTGKFKFTPVFFRINAIVQLRKKAQEEKFRQEEIKELLSNSNESKTKPLSRQYNLSIPPRGYSDILRPEALTPRLTTAVSNRNYREMLYHLIVEWQPPYHKESISFYDITKDFLQKFEEYIVGFKKELDQYPETKSKTQFLQGLDQILYSFQTVQFTDVIEYTLPEYIPTSRNPKDGTLNWQHQQLNKLYKEDKKITFDFSADRRHVKSILVIWLYVLKQEKELSQKYDYVAQQKVKADQDFFSNSSDMEWWSAIGKEQNNERKACIKDILFEIYQSSNMEASLYQQFFAELAKELRSFQITSDENQMLWKSHIISQMKLHLQGKADADLLDKDKACLDHMMSKDISTLVTEYFEKV